MLGRYVPGVVISYVLGETRPFSRAPSDQISACLHAYFLSAVVGVFLWPLISSHDVGLWLKPVLQKLDFGVGEFLQKLKEDHGNSGRPQPHRHEPTGAVLTALHQQRLCFRAEGLAGSEGARQRRVRPVLHVSKGQQRSSIKLR